MRIAKLLALRSALLIVAPLVALERLRRTGSFERAAWGWMGVLGGVVLWSTCGPLLFGQVMHWHELGACPTSWRVFLIDHLRIMMTLPYLFGIVGLVGAVTRRGSLRLLRVNAVVSFVVVELVVLAITIPLHVHCGCLM